MFARDFVLRCSPACIAAIHAGERLSLYWQVLVGGFLSSTKTERLNMILTGFKKLDTDRSVPAWIWIWAGVAVLGAVVVTVAPIPPERCNKLLLAVAMIVAGVAPLVHWLGSSHVESRVWRIPVRGGQIVAVAMIVGALWAMMLSINATSNDGAMRVVKGAGSLVKEIVSPTPVEPSPGPPVGQPFLRRSYGDMPAEQREIRSISRGRY